MGSCFSDHIGGRLKDNKFNILTNPFGVIFNPISINKLLNVSSKKGNLNTLNWITSQDIHLHHDVHSSLGDMDKQTAKDNVDSAISDMHDQLKQSKWLMITWGTAIVYEHKVSGNIVANCHKVPVDQFNKRLLTKEEIIESFESVMETLSPDLNIVLTVSPVRHLKETLELNSVSKSILRIASHELSNRIEQVQYFPAYELVLDDLRDYRFYKPDMLHPSDEAIDYVWQKFTSAYFDTSTFSFLEKWKKIRTAINHRPFNPQSDAHLKFVRSTIKTLIELKGEIDVSKEIDLLEQQLIKS